MSGADPLGVFDDHAYSALAVASAERYQTAEPFPHGVYDDFLPHDLAVRLAESFPTFDSIEWVVRDNEQNRRVYQHDETKLPALHRQMLRELNSRQFLLFVETLTGIDNLIPDPYFIGGGVHLSGPGDFLKIHADFNWHHKLQAYRRVNALLYLSETWEEEWGGAIEFWDREMTGPVDQRLSPLQPPRRVLDERALEPWPACAEHLPARRAPGRSSTSTTTRPTATTRTPRRSALHLVQDRSLAVRDAARRRLPSRRGARRRELTVSASRPLIADDAVVGPRPGTIPVAGPWITEREVEAVAAAARQLLVRRRHRREPGVRSRVRRGSRT